MIKYEILMKGIVDIMKNKKRFFYHRLLFYILGLLIMSVGSNLFLKAALGVAPSCTMALTLSYLSPVHSYALFNFLINSTFLICEALILHEFGKMQLTQLGLTFVYSLLSIASTLNELKEQNPQMMLKELFQSGMNVGRDMMGTMTNTLILAFTGGSINTLVFIFAYNYEYQQVINMYSVGIEIMQGLSSSLGVIMAVPVTSWIAAFLYSKNQK